MYDLDSVGILNMLSTMEVTDRDCGGNELDGGAPRFYKGAAVTPVYEPIQLQINKLRQKVGRRRQVHPDPGIFDMESLKRFLDLVDKANYQVPHHGRYHPPEGRRMAKYMNANVPGIAVPQDMIDRLEAAAAEGKEKGVKGLPMQLGIEMAAEFIAKIHDEKICDGVHIMAIGAEKECTHPFWKRPVLPSSKPQCHRKKQTDTPPDDGSVSVFCPLGGTVFAPDASRMPRPTKQLRIYPHALPDVIRYGTAAHTGAALRTWTDCRYGT